MAGSLAWSKGSRPSSAISRTSSEEQHGTPFLDRLHDRVEQMGASGPISSGLAPIQSTFFSVSRGLALAHRYRDVLSSGLCVFPAQSSTKRHLCTSKTRKRFTDRGYCSCGARRKAKYNR